MTRSILAITFALGVWTALPTSEARADSFDGYVCSVDEPRPSGGAPTVTITITSAPGCSGTSVNFRIRAPNESTPWTLHWFFQTVTTFTSAAGTQNRVTGSYSNTIFGRFLDDYVIRGD